MTSIRWTIATTLLLSAATTASLAAQIQPAAPTRTANAVRIVGSPPRIDGVLDDPAWTQAPAITAFVQKIPVEGAEPSVATEVRLLYDDHGLYVGARLSRPDPNAIRTSITRRDGDSDAEVFTVSLDPYLDRRTAYSFSISSGGVRGDAYHSQDSEDSGREAQYDPIWTARARVDEQGWTAEMHIPFSQLRFNASAEQTWGLELTRNIPDKSERLQWVLIPVAAAGFSSHFGRLEGIAGIPPARRLELLPYVAGDLTYRANVNPQNPFDDKVGARAGGDLKYGLGPNLTLDATINPDFGQVEADPAVVNLTAFETIFEERRPFFIEGNELLTGRGQSFIGRPSWFYSRRIGASPRGFASGDFVDAPTNTTIISAAKVTGRLASGLSVGALAAITPREYASTFDTTTGVTDRIAVEPPSSYGVLRLQQEFGSRQSNVGASLTHVRRWLDDRGGLEQLLPTQRSDRRRRLAPSIHGRDVRGHGLGRRESREWRFRRDRALAACECALLPATGSGPHLVRSDAYVAERRHGVAAAGQERRPLHARRHSAVDAVAGVRHQRRRADAERRRHRLQRRHPAPRHEAEQVRPLLSSSGRRRRPAGTTAASSSTCGSTRTCQFTLHNFWRITGRGVLHRRSLSDDLTRGGPLMGTPNAYTLTAQLTSRPNVPTTWNARTEYFDDEFGGWRWDASTGIAIRPALAVAGVRGSDVLALRGWAPVRHDARATAARRRSAGATCSRSSNAVRCRRGSALNYAFTPNFTVEAYAEPFAASGRFYDFGELPAPRSRTLRTYGAPGTGTTITKDTAGVSTVTRWRGVIHDSGARLQSAVVPLESRAAMGVAARQHGVT